MKIKSLYIAAKEKNAGSLFVSMGMMDILKKNLHRVAFFRPVIYDKDIRDGDIEFIRQRYDLDIAYEECFGVDVAYVEKMLASSREGELISELIEKFKKLEKEYDFVLCEGIRNSFFSASSGYDINVEIAKNFGAGYINVFGVGNKSAEDIFEDMRIENEYIAREGVGHFATFLNRIPEGVYDTLQALVKQTDYTVFMLKEDRELSLVTIEDIIDDLGARKVMFDKHDNTRVIRDVKVAALTLDNFLEHIEEDDLIIVPADRSDIILGLLGALHSSAYASISAIMFPFGMEIHPNVKKLIEGLESFTIPILSVDDDTFTTAKKVMQVHPRFRVQGERKIALALGVFYAGVDTILIEKQIAKSYTDIMTPQMFEYKLFDMARQKKVRIVLPESSDERILRAAEIILRRDVAEIILLADEAELRERYLRLGLDLSKASIINHHTSEWFEEFVEVFYEQRKAKGLTLQAARDAMVHSNYFATMMVQLGYADGMVSGAIHSTADTIRPALQIIKTPPGISVVSSVFFMCFETKVLVYGDCAINQEPDAATLADIAIASAKTAKLFDIEPRVAMLSYSTGESGSGEDVEKVREATNIVRQKAPELLVEGPIQYDAAINEAVAKKKLPNSKVAGRATVFIFPDLNTGNNTYKAVQRSSGAIAIGPVIQGLKKPVNDLSRGCLVNDIVNTIAITAVQAGENNENN